MLPIFIRLTRVRARQVDPHEPWLVNVMHIIDVKAYQKGGAVVQVTDGPDNSQGGYRVNQSIDVVQTLIEEAQDRVLFAGVEEEQAELESEEPCELCGGTPSNPSDACHHCDGTGKGPDFEDLPELDTLCRACLNRGKRNVQRQSFGGPTCIDGHGGADSVPIDDAPGELTSAALRRRRRRSSST